MRAVRWEVGGGWTRARKARKFVWGRVKRAAGDRDMNIWCAGARKARLHEDALEMKVSLAQKGALRAYLAHTIS